jgi:hypothetical protein
MALDMIVDRRRREVGMVIEEEGVVARSWMPRFSKTPT